LVKKKLDSFKFILKFFENTEITITHNRFLSPFLHYESRNWIQAQDYVFFPGLQLEFLIRCQEVLGLNPGPNSLQMIFSMFLKLKLFKTGIFVLKTMKNLVFISFRQNPKKIILISTSPYCPWIRNFPL
jgi:hypothetical protein